ncbi:hypothetical protein [Proteiniclasticum sp. QWL-01]|uniref:hypothetical protein n=1 Tax=Proteiniclasticum sp. QWL-01 TaxID=3036945 RepID=UPI0024107215|nr:hypothetical protein [Proteiniclasticum sp. QWL-01]WFF71990.1 hypothetical protein P6M73_11855 [Proteiniclasticum sp. QWL-01]
MGRLAKALEELYATPVDEVLRGLYEAGYSETATLGNLPDVFTDSEEAQEYISRKPFLTMELGGITKNDFNEIMFCGVAA